jgi:RNA polymerase sigma factor (sigma-70 family)
MNKDRLNTQFEQIIEQHKGILLKVARIYSTQLDDRDDLIQEMRIQIWRSWSKYNPQFAITTWMYRIAINVAISNYRKHIKRQPIQPITEQVLEVSESIHHEKELALQQLEQFIQELNELDRALILLYLEDKKQIEIADILGLSVSNVSTKIARIKEKLKQRFGV